MAAGSTRAGAGLAAVLAGEPVSGPAAGPLTGSPASTAASPAPARVDPAAILAGLDHTRSEAYAQRRPELLTGVYRSPSLLAQDTAQLTRTVPTGCRITG